MRIEPKPTYRIVQIAKEDFKRHNINFKQGDLWLVRPYKYDNEKYTLISKITKSGKIIGKNPSMNIYCQEVNHINYVENIKQIELAQTIDRLQEVCWNNNFSIKKEKLIKKDKGMEIYKEIKLKEILE